MQLLSGMILQVVAECNVERGDMWGLSLIRNEWILGGWPVHARTQLNTSKILSPLNMLNYFELLVQLDNCHSKRSFCGWFSHISQCVNAMWSNPRTAEDGFVLKLDTQKKVTTWYPAWPKHIKHWFLTQTQISKVARVVFATSPIASFHWWEKRVNL